MTTEVVHWQKEETLMVAKTYDRQTAKFLAVIGENMPKLTGDLMQRWIQDPKAVQKALNDIFCSFQATLVLKVWETIELGTGDSKKIIADLIKALENNKFTVNFCAEDIIQSHAFTVATETTEVDLVKVTVAELGFKEKESVKLDKIYNRAIKELGLEFCSLEVVLRLCLQYKNQPNNKSISIGMKPTPSFFSHRVLSIVPNYFGLCLSRFNWSSKDRDEYSPLSQWVFILPRK